MQKTEAAIIEYLRDDDRRRERRLQCQTPAEVILVQLGYSYPGTILDASSRGLRVRAARHVGAGWEVQIRIGQAIARGEVRYCTESSVPRMYEFGVLVYDVKNPVR